MSADIQSALVDAALWLYHAFFLPGDRFLARFPELDIAGHGRVVSGLLSTAAWLGAIVLTLAACRLIGDLDRALTAFVARLYEELQRGWRIAARRVTIGLRSFALERQARLTRTEVFEQPALSALQHRVLQSLADLPPAHMLSPSDIARPLGLRPIDAEKVLATLRKLSLVARTRGADDGADCYRLTKAGEIFLATFSRPHPAQATPLPERSLRPKRIEPKLGSLV